MDEKRRAFLEDLLATDSPSGFERPAQRAWIDYVGAFADEVRTDDYGNAVAVLDGDGPKVALAGHADEIGYTVRRITDDGFLRLSRIGGADRTVSRGQHVTVHTDVGPVAGVIGQTAIHLRDDDEAVDIDGQYVDIGVDSEDAAEELVDRGDPITVVQRVRDLGDDRIAARGIDNRVGIWAAAEGFRRAANLGVDGTLYAISTVQEEVGLRGARMVGFDLAPDAVVAVDVTHATDSPDLPGEKVSDVELGGGPSVARGTTNHPGLVDALRAVAEDADTPLQLEATGSRTGTDADAFYTARGGIPSVNLGIPNRYMHTPVEVVDSSDLDATAELLGAFGAEAGSFAPFAVEF